MENNTTKPVMTTGSAPRLWPKAFLFLIIVVTWYGLLRFFSLDTLLLDILARIEALGFWGPVIFTLLYVPSCILMFPDFLPNAAAGAIWGVGLGTVAVSVGRVFGSIATFLLTRYIVRHWYERKMADDPKFAAVAEALGREGFRLVLLLRLCPLFPVIMLNYTLGMTRISLFSYMMGTFLGLIPRTFFVAYVGAGAHSLAELTSGNGLSITGNPVLFWGGLVFSLIIVLVLARTSRRLINEAMQQIPSD